MKVKTVGAARKIAGVKRDSEAMAEKKPAATRANLKKKKVDDATAAVIGPFEKKPGAPWHKPKVLLVSSRGINFRHRHLMNDLEALLPHSKKAVSSLKQGDAKICTCGWCTLPTDQASNFTCKMFIPWMNKK